METELEASIRKATEIIADGRKWYVCDIVGERVFGQAIVAHFESAIPVLERITGVEDQGLGAASESPFISLQKEDLKTFRE